MPDSKLKCRVIEAVGGKVECPRSNNWILLSEAAEKYDSALCSQCTKWWICMTGRDRMKSEEARRELK